MAVSTRLSLVLLLALQLRHTAISGLVATFHPENCPSGTEANLYYNVCVHCRIGYFRERGQQARCEKCPDGFITLEEGAGLATDCDVLIGLRDTCSSGYEWSSETEQCEICPVNTYRSQVWDYWCMPCPENTSTSEEGAFSITQCIITGGCPPGTAWDAVTGWCEPCPIGWYRNHEDGADCLPCAPGLTTIFPAATAFTECQPVDTRTFTNAECPSGTEYIEEFFTCRVCPRSTFRRAGVHDRCMPCPEGNQTLYEGAVDVSLCISEQHIMGIIAGLVIETVPECPLGTEWHSFVPGCYPCPRGTYRNQSTLMACQNCPEEVSTPTWGTIDGLTCGTNVEVIENVFQPSECLAGLYWDISREACMPCQYGTYSPEGEECLPCPPATTTAFAGATSQQACVLPQPDDITTPFFDTGQCPAGSEWDSSLVGCVPCPVGFYRSTEITCLPCIEGLTTLTLGAKDPSLCFVPREGPPILPSGSEGCPRGYHNESELWCSPCRRGTYKSTEGWETCQPCQSIDGGASPGSTRYYGAVSSEECLPDARITGFSPTYGPQSGGTIMYIYLEASADFRVLTITVAGYDCRPMSQFVIGGRVECMTSAARDTPVSGPVVIAMVGGELITSGMPYMYLADPILQELDRVEGIVSGGMNVSVKGENLNSVSTPNMILYSKHMTSYADSIPIEWPCTVEHSNSMLCMLGDLDDIDVRRKRRSTSEDDVTEYYLGFTLDGVTTYSNLSATMPEYGTFSVYPDPDVFPFEVDPIIITENALNVIIEGSGLSPGVMTKDIAVTAGSSCQAEVVDLTPHSIIIKLCADLSRDSQHPVQVQIGSLEFLVGHVQMQPLLQPSSASTTDIAMPILVGISAVVLIIVLVAFLCYRWKRKKAAAPNKVGEDRGSVHSSVQCTADSAHLPPLPIDSVFGPDRVTDRGVGMRPLAFPGDDNLSYTTVESLKPTKREKSSGSITPILRTPQNAAKRRASSSQSSSQGFSSQPSTISSGSDQLPNAPLDVTT